RSIILLLLLSTNLLQAKPQQKPEEPIELLHADLSELRTEKDNIIVNLNGNVHLRHGQADLYSDRAVWYRSAGILVFIGNVKIEDPDQSIKAERVTYYQNTRRIVADENVELESKKEKAMVLGGHGEYDRNKKYLVFTQSPSLIYNPQAKDSTLTVKADTLEYYVEQKKGTAIRDVHILKGDMEATCGRAELFGQEERIVLTQNPSAKKTDSELSGDEIEILYKNNKVYQIKVTGGAKASHKEIADSLSQRYNESYLAGKTIYFFLGEDEKLKQVKVLNNATSLYFPSAKDTLSQIKNEASGDSLELFFDGSKLNQIVIIGGAIGSYYSPAETKDSLHSIDTVNYSAEKIDYQTDKNLIDLEDNCNVKYRQISLKSGKVTYDTEKEYLKAEGIYKEEEGKQKLDQLPVLMDGSEEIKGQEMSYYLQTRKGKVKAGNTQFQGGYYHGNELGRIKDDVFLASGGRYTTCDLESPHYYFYSRKMKIIAKDKVIARPVVMYIEKIPVAVIPFYIFPIKPGRHSGFLTFEVGNFVSGEYFIRNLGYYWAASDYWDLETGLDFFENTGWLVRENFRYAKRYLYSGSIAASYKRDVSETAFSRTTTDYWDLVVTHSQTLSPVTRLTANGRFINNSSYYQLYSFDPAERRNRVITSQANLATRYRGAAISLVVLQTQNLDTDSKSLNLPSLSLTQPSFSPFKSKPDQPKRWYQNLYLSFASSFQNYYSKTKLTSSFARKQFVSLDNSLHLTFPQNLFGWLILSPNLDYRETWYYVFSTDTSLSQTLKNSSPARRGTYSFGLNARTTVYGTFRPKLGRITGIRQVMTPSLDLVFVPEITRNLPFVSYTGVGSGVSKAQSLNFSFTHLLQMKTEKEGKESKFELFNYTLSTGYNFLAKEHKLSNLSSSLRSNAIPGIDIALTFTHDPYKLATKELDLLHPRLLNLNLSTTLTHSGVWGGVNQGGQGQAKSGKSYSFSLSHSYSETRYSPGTIKSHWVSLSLDFSLTEKWHVNYLTHYDFSLKQIVEQNFVFYRDLHCWEGTFTWIANGVRQGYYFRINIKALPEVKLEKGMVGIRDLGY
ncbi:MAG TPA: putative LPS assembly protein LptD, partial [Terriglobales bacterium]|nr:putative LPS assembly protein LptD [Terriglobales bacterium]